MARLVEEIMSRELFAARPDEAASDALGYLLALDLLVAPVVDERHHPIGLINLRDLVAQEGATVRQRMSVPPVAVRDKATLEEAGRLLGETGFSRVVVVNGEGRAVGAISAVDLLRALLDMPTVHHRPSNVGPSATRKQT